MSKIWGEITRIGVVLSGFIISNILADLLSQNNTVTDNISSTQNLTHHMYNIKIAVFADRATVDYYENNLIKHVMLQINKISEMFKHSSIEHSIHIYLSELKILNEKFTTNNKQNQDQFLNNFCGWLRQQKSFDDVDTFDVGIFLTRINMYEKGYASKGSMCYLKNACAVVVDDGDNTASRFIQVIGDSLSMDKNLKKIPNQRLPLYFDNTINTFFFTGKGDCLLNDSVNHLYLSQALLINKEELCQTVYGINFIHQIIYEPCLILIYCVSEAGATIASIGHIFVVPDSIKCDVDSYCYRGECKKDWNPWTTVGECHRKCGGGIQKLIRHNTSFDNQLDIISRYETCNNHKCLNDSKNFESLTRNQQCARVIVKNRNVTPYYSEKYPCRLYCSTDDELDHVLKDYYGTVIDGTPCRNDSFHFCMNGKCEYSLLTKYYDRYNFTVNLNDVYSTSENLAFTDFYSIPFYVKIVAVVDLSMVKYHKDNLTIHIQMLMAEASKILKHPSLGFSLNIVLIDIRVIEKDLMSTISSEFIDYYELLRTRTWITDIDDYDVAILFTRYQDQSGMLGLGTSSVNLPNWIVALDKGVLTISTIAHEIAHTLGVDHEFENEICNKKISINKSHFLMNYYTEPPFIWSTCSRIQLAQFLSNHLSSLIIKPEKFIDLSKVPLMGQFYSADKQCEIQFGPNFTLNRTLYKLTDQCKKLTCSDGKFNKNATNRIFDYTPCGTGKMCYDNDCFEETQLKRINGGWSQWVPTGSCSRSCGTGIRKAIRKCNNPQPEYGGDYCVGKKLRFETCNLMPCHETEIDFRQQQCSNLNNDTRNFIAIYHPEDTDQLCKLTCQVIGGSNSSIVFGNVADGTSCRNDSHDVEYMCNNGKCKKVGCTENDAVFNPNSILDICNVSRGYHSNEEALTEETKSQIFSQLLYQPLENWTLDNSCIIMYQMKKNWEMIFDYWEKEKSILINIRERLCHNSIMSWNEFYNTNNHNVSWSYLKGFHQKVMKNCPKNKNMIGYILGSYWKNLTNCRVNYNKRTEVKIASKIYPKNITDFMDYFHRIELLDNSCKDTKYSVDDAQLIIDEKSIMINNTIKLVESVNYFKNDINKQLKIIERCLVEQEKKFNESIKIFEISCSVVKEYLSLQVRNLTII